MWFLLLCVLQEATAKFSDVDSNNKTLRRRNIAKRQSWIENVSVDYFFTSAVKMARNWMIV